MDYRDLTGKFDKIVSIEMFEAVGQAYWETYFQGRLFAAEGWGRAVLQAITIEDNAFDDMLREPDFIQRYIFRTVCCPRCRASNSRSPEAGLRLVEENGFGEH